MAFGSDSSSPPPPWLQRRFQLRMIGLIVSLGIVVFAIRKTSDPEFWRNTPLVGPEERRAAEEQPPRPNGPDAPRHEVQPPRPLKPGEFLSRRGEAPNGGGADGERVSGGATLEELDLSHVEDDTLGVRRQEARAYYRVLELAARSADGGLAEKSAGRVPYSVLMLDPARYRGRVLTIEGHLRRLMPLQLPPRPAQQTAADPKAEKPETEFDDAPGFWEAFEDPAGGASQDQRVERLWEGWVFTPDSGRNPYRVVATRVPEDLPRGMELDPPVKVRVHGVFFKRQGYSAPLKKTGLHTAPLLLTDRIAPVRPEAVPVRDDGGFAYLVVGFTLLVGGGLAFVLWWYARGDRKFGDAHVRTYVEPAEGALESLQGKETHETGEMLRRLAEDPGDDDA